MTLFVDTSVWSLALRRDQVDSSDEVEALRRALVSGESVMTTGLVLQELLQGVVGPKARDNIIERFAALSFVQPDRQDYIAAASIRNTCRQRGVQIGTIDALLLSLCVRHDMTLLTMDNDFSHAAPWVKFKLWGAR